MPVPRKPYKLIATSNRRRQVHEVWPLPDSPAGDDFAATCGAIAHVMNSAATDPLWSAGRIELYSPTGELLHVMEEKNDPEAD